MKKKQILVTGSNGFVGTFLLPALIETGTYEIHSFVGDIRDRSVVEDQIRKSNPDFVVHLAAQAFVPIAIKDPWETEEINVRGTLNLLEGLHQNQKPVKMLYVSSADVYGKQRIEDLPLREDLIPNPVNPYAGSKLAAESYCRQYSHYSTYVSVVIARPFNHIGVGQRKEFVIPNFCHQIIQAKKLGESKIKIGDLTPTRDFSHVKDIVFGYIHLLEKGNSGEIYNICSGEEKSIRSMLDSLIQISKTSIQPEIDPERIRASETSRVFGDNSKLKALGWQPRFELQDTLVEIYASIENE